MPQINEHNRLPWSALHCHRDRLSTIILAPFLAVVFFGVTSSSAYQMYSKSLIIVCLEYLFFLFFLAFLIIIN